MDSPIAILKDLNMESQNKGKSQEMLYRIQFFFVLPFLINLALIFSSSSICGFIDDELLGDLVSPLPGWVFYITATVLGPAFIALTKLLPDPTYAVCAGGLLTTAGLILTALFTGPLELISYGCLSGCGICLSFISSSMCLAPAFVRTERVMYLGILIVATAIMRVQHPLVTLMCFVLKKEIFLVLAGIVLVTTVIPAVLFILYKKLHYVEVDETDGFSICSVDEEEDYPQCEHKEPSGCNELLQRILKSSLFSNGWLSSIVAVIVWIIWGTGVDTTWLSLFLTPGVDPSWVSLGWIAQKDYQLNITILQILLSIFTCLIKLFTELSTSTQYPTPQVRRIVFASNYMHLGLLGIAGLTLCIFPDYTDPIHNQMLFSFTFALQFDDLSDLDFSCRSSHSNKLKMNFISVEEKLKISGCRKVSDGISVICHFMSILIMSSMSIFLGLYFSNFAGYLVQSFQHLPLFSTSGLLVVSLISFCICIAQPDTCWRRQQ